MGTTEICSVCIDDTAELEAQVWETAVGDWAFQKFFDDRFGSHREAEPGLQLCLTAKDGQYSGFG
jgi:hypothetical protein